jgi:hypothetical protein
MAEKYNPVILQWLAEVFPPLLTPPLRGGGFGRKYPEGTDE